MACRGGGEGFLEGDDRLFVDGRRSPVLHGTGTEDFYRGGWYFLRGPFSAAFDGQPSERGGGCPANAACLGLYRLLLTDAWIFADGIEARLEHGGDNGADAAYSSTTFWYGDGRSAALVETDAVDIGDRASEEAHGYLPAEPGAVEALASSYEAAQSAAPVTEDLRVGTEPVTFTLAIDQENVGVVLRRMSDQYRGGQEVEVSIDGTRVGTWRQALENRDHRWLDDEYLLPESVCAGKSRIQVTLAPAPGAPPWSAANYWALSRVAI